MNLTHNCSLPKEGLCYIQQISCETNSTVNPLWLCLRYFLHIPSIRMGATCMFPQPLGHIKV